MQLLRFNRSDSTIRMLYAVEVEWGSIGEAERTEHRIEEWVERHDDSVVVLACDAVERGPAEHIVAEAALEVRAQHDGVGGEQLARPPVRQRGSARVRCAQRRSMC